MGDVFVLKAAHNVHNGVHLADVGQELIAQSLALGRAAHQTGDIDKLDDGRGDLFGIIHLGQHIQPLVRNRHHAGIGLYRAKRIVGRLRSCLGNGIEQRAFADIRQSHNAQFHI